MNHIRRTAQLVLLAIAVAIAGYKLAATHASAKGIIAEELFTGIRATESATFFTPGAQIPDVIPLPISTGVSGTYGGLYYGEDAVQSILTTIGGVLEGSGNDIQVVDAIESQVPLLDLATPLGGESYVAVMDGALLDFDDESSGGNLMFVARDVLRSVVTAQIYYDGGPVLATEFDEENIEIVLLDAATVDEDGNLIPDASRLPEETTQILDLDGNFSFVFDLGPPDRGFSTESGDFTVETTTGPVEFIVYAPDLDEIIEAETSYSDVTMGKVIVTIASDASILLDTPEGADPADQFDLVDNDSSAPSPRNLFIRTILCVRRDVRGATPTWSFIDTLPSPLEISIEIGGRGIANILDADRAVYGYEYALPVSQNGENILADQNDSGWAFAEVGVFNVRNGDDFDAQDGRGGTVPVEFDDTIFFTSTRGTAIFGSNAMPELRSSGGGGGGGCFIATAAYGTPMAAEIESLRAVRDTYLMDTALGTAFVDAYYRISPPIAGVVAESRVAKAVVRAALAPVMAVSGWTMAAPDVVAGIALIVLAFGAVCVSRTKRRSQRE